jgi:hypothetical protein
VHGIFRDVKDLQADYGGVGTIRTMSKWHKQIHKCKHILTKEKVQLIPTNPKIARACLERRIRHLLNLQLEILSRSKPISTQRSQGQRGFLSEIVK